MHTNETAGSAQPKARRSILFITSLNFWSISQGKGAPSFYNTVNGYVSDGWDVHVVMAVEEPNFGSDPANLHLYHRGFPLLARLARIRHLFVPFRFLMWLAFNAFFLFQAGKILRTKPVDVIYAYEVDGVPAAKRLSNRFHKPLVTRFMGTVLHGKTKDLKTRIALWYHFIGLKCKADLTIMTNDGTNGDRVLKELQNKSLDVRFWRNGVNEVDVSGTSPQLLRERFKLGSNSRVLMCVSRLVAWKRLDRSILAMKAMVETSPYDLRLVIVGDGDHRPELEALTARLGLTDRILFVGGVPQKEVYSYMMLADIFLSLYDIGNLGNPLFEAMRCGKPIVTLNNGDTASMIKNEVNGILLDPAETDGIAKSILRLLDDQELAGRLGSNALEYANEHFRTWQGRIAEELEVVSGIIAGGKRS